MATKTKTKTKTKTRAKSSNGKPKTAAPAKNRITNVGTAAEIVEIQEFKIGSLRVRLNGASALVTHNFGAKSRHEMLGKQTGTDTDTDRELRCPVEEFMEAAYPVHGPQKPKPKIKDGRKIYDEKAVHNWFAKTAFGIPIVAFKNALVSTGRTSSEFNMAGLQSLIRPHRQRWIRVLCGLAVIFLWSVFAQNGISGVQKLSLNTIMLLSMQTKSLIC